jgi:hypothetical protein
MNEIDSAEDVTVREVAEWSYRTLDDAVSGVAGHNSEKITRRAGDDRHLMGVYALEVHGDMVSYYELHTSDGSIFTVHIGRQV